MSMLRLEQDGRIGQRVPFVEWGFLVALLILIAAPNVATAQRPILQIQLYKVD
jgi:hypothetical protein